MAVVGIIANPSAGKDIRRLVAHGRVVSNQEKSNILRRVFAGVASTDTKKILIMPDHSGLSISAAADVSKKLEVEYLDMRVADSQESSTLAAQKMYQEKVDCIVTLGGDGTNRVVAKGSKNIPLVPISTGTNNVFPAPTEGTLAGIVAGRIADKTLSIKESCNQSKKIDIFCSDEFIDDALVDVAISKEMFVGARAVWDINTLHSIILTRAEPVSIGLSSIGSRIENINIDDPFGLYIILDKNIKQGKKYVEAPIAPGTIPKIKIVDYKKITTKDKIFIETYPGTIALDGEREIELLPDNNYYAILNLDGPWVASIPRSMKVLSNI